MTTKHSPGPWRRTGDGLAVVAADGHKVISPAPHKDKVRTEEERNANLDRILACVNACVDVPSELLWTGLLSELWKLSEHLLDRRDAGEPGLSFHDGQELERLIRGSKKA
jgi:hypothetical protein